jgi:hypothetical protein
MVHRVEWGITIGIYPGSAVNLFSDNGHDGGGDDYDHDHDEHDHDWAKRSDFTG